MAASAQHYEDKTTTTDGGGDRHDHCERAHRRLAVDTRERATHRKALKGIAERDSARRRINAIHMLAWHPKDAGEGNVSVIVGMLYMVVVE